MSCYLLQASKPVTEDALRDIKAPVLQQSATRTVPAPAAPAQQLSHPAAPQGQQPASGPPSSLPKGIKAPTAGPGQPTHPFRPPSSAPAPVSLFSNVTVYMLACYLESGSADSEYQAFTVHTCKGQ